MSDPIKCNGCEKTFRNYDECDTLGSESGVCCPDCGGEDFTKSGEEIYPEDTVRCERADTCTRDALCGAKKPHRSGYCEPCPFIPTAKCIHVKNTQ